MDSNLGILIATIVLSTLLIVFVIYNLSQRNALRQEKMTMEFSKRMNEVQIELSATKKELILTLESTESREALKLEKVQQELEKIMLNQQQELSEFKKEIKSDSIAKEQIILTEFSKTIAFSESKFLELFKNVDSMTTELQEIKNQGSIQARGLDQVEAKVGQVIKELKEPLTI